jgi:hypothetical protein
MITSTSENSYEGCCEVKQFGAGLLLAELVSCTSMIMLDVAAEWHGVELANGGNESEAV